MHAERPDAGTRCGALLEEHGQALGRACMAWLGDRSAADAAVEDVVVQALEGMGQRANEGTLRGWLFGLALRACARRLEAGATAHEAPFTQRLPGSPVEVTRRALGELLPTERDAIVLRFVAGLTVSDVAQATRVDERVARERINKGLGKLRASLAGGR